MKEYRVVFKYRPGTDKIPPEYIFVETEDEDGNGIGGHDWIEMEGDLTALALPVSYDFEMMQVFELLMGDLQACMYYLGPKETRTDNNWENAWHRAERTLILANRVLEGIREEST